MRSHGLRRVPSPAGGQSFWTAHTWREREPGWVVFPSRLRTEDVSSGLILEGGRGVFNFSVIFGGVGGEGWIDLPHLLGGIYHSVIDYRCDSTWHLHVYIIAWYLSLLEVLPLSLDHKEYLVGNQCLLNRHYLRWTSDKVKPSHFPMEY